MLAGVCLAEQCISPYWITDPAKASLSKDTLPTSPRIIFPSISIMTVSLLLQKGVDLDTNLPKDVGVSGWILTRVLADSLVGFTLWLVSWWDSICTLCSLLTHCWQTALCHGHTRNVTALWQVYWHCHLYHLLVATLLLSDSRIKVNVTGLAWAAVSHICYLSRSSSPSIAHRVVSIAHGSG